MTGPGAAVHAVIVGLGGHGDRGALEGRDGRGRRVEDVRLALGLGARPVGHRGLEVDHAELGPGEELRDGRAEGRRGVLGQVGADGAREVDVAAEAERDGLAVAGPVRVERGVLREVLRGGGAWWVAVGVLGGGLEPPEKNAK